MSGDCEISELSQTLIESFEELLGKCLEFEMFMSGEIVESQTGDKFITWNIQGNGGYPLTAYQGTTLNTIINPYGYDNTGISNTYETANFGSLSDGTSDVLITVLDNNNEIGIIKLGHNNIKIYNLSDDTDNPINLLHTITFSDENLRSNGILMNPHAVDDLQGDLLLFATDKHIYVYNMTKSSGFILYDVQELSSMEKTLKTNFSIGCNSPYNHDIVCYFFGMATDDSNFDIQYDPYSKGYVDTGMYSPCDAYDTYKSDSMISTSANDGNEHLYHSCLGNNYASPYNFGIITNEFGSSVTYNFTFPVFNPLSYDYTSTQNGLVRGGATNLRYLIKSDNFFNKNAVNYGLQQIRNIWSYDYNTKYLALPNADAILSSPDELIYSNFFVGDYNRDGVKEFLIFVKNITGATNYLYEWDSLTAGDTLQNYDNRYEYPYNMDVTSNTWLMGAFKVGEQDYCFGGYQGITCSLSEGSWLFEIDTTTNDKNFYDKFSAGITTNNGKPYYVVNYPYSNGNIPMLVYDSFNGVHGSNYDAQEYKNSGLLWWNMYNLYDAKNPNKNIANMSEIASSTEMDYDSTDGYYFESENSDYLTLPHGYNLDNGSIYLKFKANSYNTTQKLSSVLYQEVANSSIETSSGTWFGPDTFSSINDSDFNTAFYFGNSVSVLYCSGGTCSKGLYEYYTIPTGYTNATLKIKNSYSGTEYKTIPNSCFNYSGNNSVKIKILGTEVTGSNSILNYYCYTDEVTPIRLDSEIWYASPPHEVYESALFWGTNTTSDIILNSTLFSQTDTVSGSNGSVKISLDSTGHVQISIPDDVIRYTSSIIIPKEVETELIYIWNDSEIHSLYINGVYDGQFSSSEHLGSKDYQPFLSKTAWDTSYFNGTIAEFKIYNKQLNSTEINPPTYSTGYCFTNNECDNTEFPYCVLGCCVNWYDNTYPSGYNQCSGDDTNCHDGSCARPLNSSFSGYTCVNGYQNFSCYNSQVLYDFYNNIDTQNTTCSQEMLDYIENSNNPEATCTMLTEDTCVQDIVNNIEINYVETNFNWLTNWINNEYEDNFTYYYYSCAGGHVISINSEEENCLICGLYCDLIDNNTGIPTFNTCENQEQCLNGECNNINCAPDYEICSDGSDFSTTEILGDVYKCNSNGSAYELITDCNQNQNCSEITSTHAECRNRDVYYCSSNGVDCNLYYNNGGSIPSSCYSSLTECYNSIGNASNSNNMLGDGSNKETMALWNTILGGSSFLKIMFSLILIIGCIYLPLHFIPNAHFILSLISGFLAMVVCTIFGLIPFYFIVIVIIGSFGLFFLSKMLGSGTQNT
jgi:hypothetical protein